MKGCGMKQTSGKEDQGSRQAETAAGETPVAVGVIVKGILTPVLPNAFIILPKGFLNERLQRFLMWRTPRKNSEVDPHFGPP